MGELNTWPLSCSTNWEKEGLVRGGRLQSRGSLMCDSYLSTAHRHASLGLGRGRTSTPT